MNPALGRTATVDDTSAPLAREFATRPLSDEFWAGEVDDLSRSYRDLPVLDQNVVWLWEELGAHCRATAAMLGESFEITVYDDLDPYATSAEMLADIDRGIYKVTSLHSHHPVWDVATNVAFRITHDITGHALTGSDFSFKGEVTAYRNQCMSTPEHLWPVLFTEVVAQSAYANIHHLFGEQKVALIPLTQAEIDAHVGQIMDQPDAAYDATHRSAARKVSQQQWNEVAASIRARQANSLTLFRGEGSHDRPSYYPTQSGEAGGWWTTDLASAQQYAKSTEDGKVYTIDVDESEAERRGLPKYRFIPDPEVRARRRLYTGSFRQAVSAKPVLHLLSDDDEDAVRQLREHHGLATTAAIPPSDEVFGHEGLQRIISDKGFTVHSHFGDAPTQGFMVSTVKNSEEVYPLASITAADIAAYRRKHAAQLANPNSYMGAWVWEGNVYLDVSTHVPEESQALALARQHDQLGIYDLATGDTIETSTITAASRTRRLAMRTCDRCGGRVAPFMPRKRLDNGDLVCRGCENLDQNSKALEDFRVSALDVGASEPIRVWAGSEWGEALGRALEEAQDPDTRRVTVEAKISDGTYETIWTDGMEMERKVAHDSGDGVTIYHCFSCGAGSVIARSDGTAECQFCQKCFTVQVQPTLSATPQTINGVPHVHPDMPGSSPDTPPAQPAQQSPADHPASPVQQGDHDAKPAPDDPTKPKKHLPPWLQDKKSSAISPSLYDHPSYRSFSHEDEEEDEDEAKPKNHWLDGYQAPLASRSALYLTADGVLPEEAYQRYLALRFADDREQVLATLKSRDGK